MAIGSEPHPSATQQGKDWTRAEVLIRQWASSNNPVLQKAFIELAYGKTPDRVEMTGKDGAELPAVKQSFNLSLLTVQQMQDLDALLTKVIPE